MGRGVNEFPAHNTIEAGESILVTGKTEEYKIDYEKLAEAVLNEYKSATIGSKTVFSVLNEITDILPTSGAGFHNSVFRGKNLGSTVTDAQSTAIKNGTFDDIFVGDYWKINNIIWRVAECDLYYRCGDNSSLDHCLAIVPDNCLLNGDGKTTLAAMNDTDITTGGYVGSKMYTETIPGDSVLGKITAAFGNHVYQHREYLCKSVSTTGVPNGGDWYDSKCELMNEVQVYGSVVNGVNASMAGSLNIGIGNKQLSLFRLAPQFLHTRQNYWLRDICSSSSFACVSGCGDAIRRPASGSWFGVRPLFLIH